jgi:glycosyltransferase involved in cell wall biosynthesis
MSISAIIITENEEKNLQRCIESLKFVEEIIIIDDKSKDKTLEIAEKYKAKIYSRNLNGDFSSQRNFGLEKAKGDWILFIDADEVITPNLRNEIIQVTADPLNKNNGYFIQRKDILWGKQLNYGEWGKTRLLRLARSKKGKWKRRVHEYWDIKGSVSALHYPLLHNSHENLREFISHINYFSTLHAKANLEEKKRSTIFKIIFWPIFKFIKNWIILLGFLDGSRGFIVALLMSVHSFLSWSKLWLNQNKIK